MRETIITISINYGYSELQYVEYMYIYTSIVGVVSVLPQNWNGDHSMYNNEGREFVPPH